MFGRLLLTTCVCIVLGGAPGYGQAGFYDWGNPNGGAWTESANWQSNSYPRRFFDFATFNIPGTYDVAVTSGSPIAVAAIDITQGTINLSTTQTLGGTVLVAGGVASAQLHLTQGMIHSSDGHLIQARGTLILAAGTTLSGGAGRNYAVDVGVNGSLFGNGVVDGNVVRNFGVISPGSGPGLVGNLRLGTVSGGLDQRTGGTLEIDLSDTGHDAVHALETSLAGVLVVQLVDGYIPGQGDQFEVLSSSNPINGTFESILWPDGADFEMVYSPNAVTILVTAVWQEEAEAAVSMDIKPGSCPNPVNSSSRGVIPVAVMFPEGTDLSGLDPSSIMLSGVPALRMGIDDVSSPVESACDCEERGPDGLDDVVLKFDTQDVMATLGDLTDGQVISLPLSGTYADGSAFAAEDCIRIIAKKGKKQKAPDIVSLQPEVWFDSQDASIGFRIPTAGRVRVTVLDVQGRLLDVLADEYLSAGEFSRQSSRALAGGVYFYRLETETGVVTAKAISIP